MEDFYLDAINGDRTPHYGLQPDGSYRCQLGWVFSADQMQREKRVFAAVKDFADKRWPQKEKAKFSWRQND